MESSNQKLICISLSPHISTEAGHHYIYQTCIQKAMERIGIPFYCYLSKNARVFLPNHRWIKWFDDKKGLWERIKEYFKITSLYRRQKTLYVLESFGTFDLASLFLGLIFLFTKKNALCLVYRYDITTSLLKGKPIIWISKLLHFFLKDRFIAATDSESIAEELSETLKKTFHLFPIPHVDLSITKKNKNKDLICWWPGKPRKAKGLKEIQYLVKKLKPKDGIILALSKETKIASNPSLILLPQVLTRDEYVKNMQQADLILLPYDPLEYRVNTSGIFIEAVLAGKIPLVKKETWLAKECESYDLKELVIDWENESLISDIKRISQSEKVNQKLHSMRQKYHLFHNMERFNEVWNEIICSLQ